MRVHIPTPLRSYTASVAWVDADGATIRDVLADLEARYPGIRFRMIDEQGRLRRHVRRYVHEAMTRDLETALAPTSVVTIRQSLSGG